MRLFQRRNVFGSPPTFPPPHLPLSRPPRPSHPSPPGYYFRAGTGAGKSMWHIYLPHGGWCRNANECVGRSKTALGSSTFYPDDPTNATIPSPGFNGILSSNSSINPPFYNWNLVRLIYCDGGGYSGTAGRLEINNDTAINLDGWNIVQAVIEGAL
ncbi:unnamed protein product [Closterium sp. NIES-65]|nr:unnamed protein product [Closterium sp. NIES-65]